MRFHNCAMVAVVVVVVSALFLASASASSLPRKLSQPDELITKLCKKTDNVRLCIKSVTENIKGKPTGISILHAEIDATIKEVNVALAKVASLGKSASKLEKRILATCKENYEYGIDSLNDTKKARDHSSVSTYLSASISYASTCEDSYADFSLPSPFTNEYELIKDLAGNSLVIAKEIVL